MNSSDQSILTLIPEWMVKEMGADSSTYIQKRILNIYFGFKGKIKQTNMNKKQT